MYLLVRWKDKKEEMKCLANECNHAVVDLLFFGAKLVESNFNYMPLNETLPTIRFL